ncbi:hypothetical protein [Pediococcus pentosaceus]|uniref:hypothetical protein n=1 Tax=Pediococcus pentosaceus TaxID=1255 RepID=UPI0018A1429B|nr:hypothetical protein [Pediococcus pentosaceus]MBF7137249.1 hypothetical protein [Pediococcus pentosaceus]
MNLRVNRNNEHPKNNPMPSISAVNKDRVTATIFCENQKTFDEVKVFKDDLKGLPRNQMRFIEAYEEDMDEYYLIKVDDIEKIEYSKDKWED